MRVISVLLFNASNCDWDWWMDTHQVTHTLLCVVFYEL